MMASMIRVVPSTLTPVVTPPARRRFAASHSTGPLAEHSSIIMALPFASSTSVNTPRQNILPYFRVTSSGLRI